MTPLFYSYLFNCDHETWEYYRSRAQHLQENEENISPRKMDWHTGEMVRDIEFICDPYDLLKPEIEMMLKDYAEKLPEEFLKNVCMEDLVDLFLDGKSPVIALQKAA